MQTYPNDGTIPRVVEKNSIGEPLIVFPSPERHIIVVSRGPARPTVRQVYQLRESIEATMAVPGNALIVDGTQWLVFETGNVEYDAALDELLTAAHEAETAHCHDEDDPLCSLQEAIDRFEELVNPGDEP
jgi:hypothetical protein